VSEGMHRNLGDAYSGPGTLGSSPEVGDLPKTFKTSVVDEMDKIPSPTGPRSTPTHRGPQWPVFHSLVAQWWNTFKSEHEVFPVLVFR
jgi:hypothetical protein